MQTDDDSCNIPPVTLAFYNSVNQYQYSPIDLFQSNSAGNDSVNKPVNNFSFLSGPPEQPENISKSDSKFALGERRPPTMPISITTPKSSNFSKQNWGHGINVFEPESGSPSSSSIPPASESAPTTPMSTVSNTNHGHSSNSSSLFLSPESNGGFMHPSHLMRRDSDISMENFSTNSIPDSPTLQFTGINIPSSPKFAESGRRILHPGRIHRGRQKTHSFHSFNTIPTTDMQLDDIKIDLSFSNGADRMVKSPLRSSISKTRHKSALRSISPHPDFDNRFISRLLKEDSQVIDKEIAHEKITTSFLRTGVPPPVSSEKSHKESVLRNSTQAETESIGTDSPRSMASFVDDWAMDGFDLPLRVSPIPANLIKSPVPYLSNSSKLNPENSFISRQSELLSSPSLSPLSNSALYGLFPGLERNKRKQSVDADQQEPSKRQLRFNSPPTLSLHHERSMSPYQLPHSSSISLGKTQSLSSSDLSDAGQNLFANHEQNILSSKSTEKNAKASSSGSTGWTANGPRGQNQVHVLLNSNPLFTRRLLNIQGAEGDLKNLKID